MANSYLSETPQETTAMNRLRMAALIADLSRSMAILAADIEHEERRLDVFDESDPTYPLLARTLRMRRDNISATIASLEAAARAAPRAA